MAEKIAEVAVRIGADTKGLRTGLRETETALDKLKAAGLAATKALAAGAVTAATAVAALTAHGIALGDELADAADKIGLTVTQLAGLRYSAQFAGIESAKLEAGMAKLGMQVSKAASGNKEATASLHALGLSAEELRKLPLDEQMLRVADALEGVKNQTDKLRLSQELFGRGAGTSFVGYFKQGTAAIREQLAEAQRLGMHMDTTQKRVVSEAADAADKLKTAYDGLSIQLAATLGPAIKAATDRMTEFLVAVKDTLPLLTSWLGLTASADLSDAALAQSLNDATLALIKNNAAYEQNRKVRAEIEGKFGKGMARTQLDGAANKLLEERNALIEKRTELEAQAAARMKAAAAGSASGAVEDTDPVIAAAKKNHEKSAAYANSLFASATDTLEAEYAASIKRLEDLDVEMYGTKIEALTSWQDIEREMAQQHESYLTKIKREGVDQRLEFEKKTTMEKTAFVLDDLKNMTAGVAQHSKTMFKVNKALALADVAVTLPATILKSLNNSGGYPWGLPAAAAALATGVAQINAIKRTQFEGGGGGTTPSAAASSPVVNGQPQAAAGGGGGGGNQRLTVEGLSADSLMTGSSVRMLAQKLLEFQKDGGTVVFHG